MPFPLGVSPVPFSLVCGVSLWLLLFLSVLFLLFLLSSGLGLALLLASAGVLSLAPSLSGSWVLPLPCGVALVGLLLRLCRLWLRPFVRLVTRACLCLLASVLAGLLLAGSVPLRLLRLALWPLKLLPLVGWPFGVALRWVVRGCSRGFGVLPPRGLESCRGWLLCGRVALNCCS